MSSRRLDTTLIDAQTVVNSAGVVNSADLMGVGELAIYVTFDHTSSAGVVLIETAPIPTYSGTWAVLATINWAAIDKVHYVAITGVFRAVRARVSSAITAGTVTVQLVGSST